MGHHISISGHSVNKSNFQSTTNMPTPTNSQELRRLIGMATFLSRFLNSSSETLQFLHIMISQTL